MVQQNVQKLPVWTGLNQFVLSCQKLQIHKKDIVA